MKRTHGAFIKLLGKMVSLGRMWIKVCRGTLQFLRLIFPQGRTLAE